MCGQKLLLKDAEGKNQFRANSLRKVKHPISDLTQLKREFDESSSRNGTNSLSRTYVKSDLSVTVEK